MRKEKKQSLYEKFRTQREHNSPEPDGAHNWAISYGDMITLLLAFFVLFFNINPQNSSDFALLVQMIDKEFNKVPTKEDPTRTPSAVWGQPTQSTEGEYAQLSPALKNKFESAVTVEKNRMIIEFPNISFFTSNSFVMTTEGQIALERFAHIFKEFTGEMRLIVRGYTDNRPVKFRENQRFQDNLELSALRAISALRILENKGVPFELMRIGGYGETDKAEIRSPAQVMQYDRKVVLVIEPLDETERGFQRKSNEQKNKQPHNDSQQGESV